MNELELISQAKTGDHTAFNALMDIYMPKVFGLAMQMTGNYADAEDISQETFIRAFQALPKFRQEASFGTWVFRIAWNTAMGMKKRYNNRLVDVKGEEAEMVADSSESALDRLCDDDRKEKLKTLIQKLPPRQRLILSMRIYENLQFQQIATIVKRTVGSVKANYFHAVKSLQAAFTKEGSR